MNVLVTGSSRGIGLSIAERFKKNGNTVIINGRSMDRLNGAVNLIGESRVIAVAADVSKSDEVSRMFEYIEKKVGGVDVLINNAGIAYNGLFQDMAQADIERVTGTNLMGTVYCSHAAIPHMLRKKKGCIINISSVWGERGASCEAVYAMTKGGINALTKSLAKELGPSGIRVNAIACGVIDTEMNSFLSDSEREALIDSIALSRFGTATEVADVAFFLSTGGADYLNGQVITLDGAMCSC